MPAPFPRQPAPTPTLDLPLAGGGRVGLAATTPHQFTMVVDYRGEHCPQCRRQLSELDSRLGGLRDVGVDKVVAVSGDDQGGPSGPSAEWSAGSCGSATAWTRRRCAPRACMSAGA